MLGDDILIAPHLKKGEEEKSHNSQITEMEI